LTALAWPRAPPMCGVIVGHAVAACACSARSPLFYRMGPGTLSLLLLLGDLLLRRAQHLRVSGLIAGSPHRVHPCSVHNIAFPRGMVVLARR
jgi:hypothetical protein